MAVPTDIGDLSTTAASNSPAGTETPSVIDDHVRALGAILKQAVSKGSDIASSGTIAVPDPGNYFDVTGTTTITTISDSWDGRIVVLQFDGALQLTHSSGLVLFGSNITTVAGDTIVLVNESTGVWRAINYGGQVTGQTINLSSNTLTGTTAQFNTALSDGTFATAATHPRKNVLLNGGFTVNQEGYVSAATLASGAYGHDQWKGGAAGGNYSFTQLSSNTTITIAAGKSLIQIIAPEDVHSTAYMLSWTGTAQGRYATDSDTPTGSYADSPIAITGQTAGTVMSVEFDDGTLGEVFLEAGTSASSFEQRPFAEELALCQRFFEKSYDQGITPGTASVEEGRSWVYVTQTNSAAHQAGHNQTFAVPKRSAPSITMYSPDSGTAAKAYDYAALADITATLSITGTTAFSWFAAKDAASTSINIGIQWVADARL